MSPRQPPITTRVSVLPGAIRIGTQGTRLLPSLSSGACRHVWGAKSRSNGRIFGGTGTWGDRKTHQERIAVLRDAMLVDLATLLDSLDCGHDMFRIPPKPVTTMPFLFYAIAIFS